MTKGIDRSEIKKTIAEFHETVEELKKTLPPTSKPLEVLHKLLGQLFKLVESEDRLADKADKTELDQLEKQLSSLRVITTRLDREHQGPGQKDLEKLERKIHAIEKKLQEQVKELEKDLQIAKTEIAKITPQLLGLHAYFEQYLNIERQKAALVLCNLSESDLEATMQFVDKERENLEVLPEERNARLKEMVTGAVLAITKFSQEEPERLAKLLDSTPEKEKAEVGSQ